jgi:hypothetical protein
VVSINAPKFNIAGVNQWPLLPYSNSEWSNATYDHNGSFGTNTKRGSSSNGEFNSLLRSTVAVADERRNTIYRAENRASPPRYYEEAILSPVGREDTTYTTSPIDLDSLVSTYKSRTVETTDSSNYNSNLHLRESSPSLDSDGYAVMRRRTLQFEDFIANQSNYASYEIIHPRAATAQLQEYDVIDETSTDL